MPSNLIVGRVARYPLRPSDETEAAPTTPGAQPQAADPSASSASPEVTTLESVATRLAAELERARNEHYALSLTALKARASDDLAPGTRVHGTVETAARELLGGPAELDLVASDNATLWLILPGVLPKRAHAVAEHLQTLLAADALTIAIVGYPRDGTTAERLVQRCLNALSGESTAEDEAAVP
jgi:hypothetical protein